MGLDVAAPDDAGLLAPAEVIERGYMETTSRPFVVRVWLDT